MRRIKRMIFKHFNCIPWFIVGIQIMVLDLHPGNDLDVRTK